MNTSPCCSRRVDRRPNYWLQFSSLSWPKRWWETAEALNGWVRWCFHVFVFALRGDENWWKTLKHTEALFGARWARIPPMWVQDYKQLWYNCYIWYCMWAVYHIYTIIYTLNIFKCIILNYNISNTLPSPGLIHVYSGDHKMRQMQWLRLQAALLYEARAGRCFGYCSGQRSSSSWNVSSDVPGF